MQLLLLLAALPGLPDLPESARAALERGEFAGTPRSFRIIALSHLADGCAARAENHREAARACIERAFRQARGLRRDGADFHGLHLSHLALILGAAHDTGPCLDEALHRRVARALARASLRDPTGHAPSYPGRPERWPADQTVTLAALRRYDRHHHQDLTGPVLARWKAFVSKHATDEQRGLPWSEANGRGTGKLPRGCALSWSVRYLAEVDPELAAAWWKPYAASYLVDRVVLVGFREWPPGVERRADVDSGPIVQGVGAAATAFGIAAARAMGDDLLAARLEATAALVGMVAERSPDLRRHARSTLAEAILFQVRAQPRLDG